MRDNYLTRHLDEVGESYPRHLRHAVGTGVRMMGCGIACILHGIFPFLFEHTASNFVKGIYRGMAKRTEAPNWERHPII